MSSTYVLLPPQPATAQTEFEYLVSQDGRHPTMHASSVPAFLPAATGAGSEVVAIAPAAALSWHRVELPQGVGPRSPRLRAVLEGLLEERLLDDPDQVHFALQPQALAGAPAWVAVCDRAWLRSAVQALEAAGRPVSRIVPEFAPEGLPTLHALGEPEDARLVCTGPDGVILLPLTANSLSLLPQLPESTRVVAEPAVAAQAEQVLQHTPALLPPSARLLSAAQTGWDLAQFEFASTGRARLIKRASTGWAAFWRDPRWRPARWGAAVLVASQLVGLNAWAWKERSGLAAKREAAQSILRQTFPQVRAIVDAPVQMEREVAALRQAAGGTSGRDLEALLAAVAAAAPAARASAVEYNGSELRLRGVAAGDADRRTLLQSLRTQGYSGQVQGDVLVVRPEAQP